MKSLFLISLLFVFKTSLAQSIDTSQYAIIPLKNCPSVFAGGYKSTSLSTQEIDEVEQILSNGIKDYNHDLLMRCPRWRKKDSSQFLINLKNYNRQYVVAINSKNEKEVWVNCLIRTLFGNSILSSLPWKQEVITAQDGGNAFFNVKINLTQKKYYDLSVNGQG